MWYKLTTGRGLYRVVVSTAAFHAGARSSFSGPGLKETKMFLPHPLVKLSIVWSLRDREITYSASDIHGSNFEFSSLEGSDILLISGGSPGPI